MAGSAPGKDASTPATRAAVVALTGALNHTMHRVKLWRAQATTNQLFQLPALPPVRNPHRLGTAANVPPAKAAAARSAEAAYAEAASVMDKARMQAASRVVIKLGGPTKPGSQLARQQVCALCVSRLRLCTVPDKPFPAREQLEAGKLASQLNHTRATVAKLVRSVAEAEGGAGVATDLGNDLFASDRAMASLSSSLQTQPLARISFPVRVVCLRCGVLRGGDGSRGWVQVPREQLPSSGGGVPASVPHIGVPPSLAGLIQCC